MKYKEDMLNLMFSIYLEEEKMDELLELLEDIKEDVDFEHCDTLIDDHIIDSFDILQIISTLNDHYDISIPASEIVPENFNSAKALYAMVERLMEE